MAPSTRSNNRDKRDYEENQEPRSSVKPSGVSKAKNTGKNSNADKEKSKAKKNIENKMREKISAKNEREKELATLRERLERARLDLQNPEIPKAEKQKLTDESRTLMKQIEDNEVEIDKIVNEIETTAGRVDGRMDVDSDNENQGQAAVEASRAPDKVDEDSNVPFSPQTKPIFNGESPSSYSAAEEEPSHYADFPSLADDDDGPDGILDDGIRLCLNYLDFSQSY
ncbi:uncharacterized protein PFLUO_LOCUS5867 [Penicillium psychrofluorescens]|uniref:uncharacterized protein n=1 Tax=Penicillium psychrofluorescens TaxID=3158075 RepID=UPI003CCD99E5